MDANERQLITDLFERIRAQGPVTKDSDAAALIAQGVRAMPDAPYMLVQSVIVQDMALGQADERIRELEARVQELEASRSEPQQSGGFLGGLFGGSGGRAAPSAPLSRGGSVPASGPSYGSAHRSSSTFAGRPAPAPSSPWGGAPASAPQPAASQGGGFLRSAMATAAGVAGGMLLADGIRNMMNSGSGGQTASSDTASSGETASAAEYQNPADNDPGSSYEDSTQDASYDDGGGDFGSMDI